LPPLPTLLPTSTGSGPATPQPTRATATVGPTATAIDFDQPVVSLTYAIPGLGLERSLAGTISSNIILSDLASGSRLTKTNQAAVLLDVQQVLENIELVDYPADCPGCVRLDYSLPLSGLEGSGWLQDELILASLENYFAANLGPHFPADTVVGLRRSATAFYAAHTLAVTGDGRLWFWSAAATEVSLPAAGDTQGTTLIAAAEQLDLAELATSYQADCPASAIESLYLATSAPIFIAVQCPELALPATLTSFYAQLAAEIDGRLGEFVLPAELDRFLPLAGILYYERPDAALVMYADGRVDVQPAGPLASSVPITETISYSGSFTFTTPISLTQNLRDLNMLRGPLSQEITARGLVTDTDTIDPYLLILRDDIAVWAATWDTPPASLAVYTSMFDQLIDQLLATFLPKPTVVPEPSETPLGTETPAATLPAATPSATFPPSPSPTPEN
ncbi:MAG: hypothetical protein KDE59_05010, partial [Anaerolineales bacterium]|nr:hypothetical protein [Anaerolineales bacterium]